MYLKPNLDCKDCYGRGEVFDIVPYGSTTAHLPSFCHCIEEQIPEGREEEEIEIVEIAGRDNETW